MILVEQKVISDFIRETKWTFSSQTVREESQLTIEQRVWGMSGSKITVVLGQTVHSRGCPGVKQNINPIDIIAII